MWVVCNHLMVKHVKDFFGLKVLGGVYISDSGGGRPTTLAGICVGEL